MHLNVINYHISCLFIDLRYIRARSFVSRMLLRYGSRTFPNKYEFVNYPLTFKRTPLFPPSSNTPTRTRYTGS